MSNLIDKETGDTKTKQNAAFHGRDSSDHAVPGGTWENRWTS